MARILAIDCDTDEFRAAIIDAGGSSLRLIAATTFERTTTPAELRKALGALGDVAKLDASVVASRRDVELKPMSLPPAPDDELPSMVQFQAQREMTTPENGPLDFLPLPVGGEPGRRVIAARLAPAMHQMIQQMLAQSGGKASCLSLRSAAVAALAAFRLPEATSPLVVDVRGAVVDASVIDEGRAAFFRNFRLIGEDVAAQAEALARQIRQSIVAAQAEGAEVASIVLCGDSAIVVAAAERLVDVQLPVHRLSAVEAAGGAPSDLALDLDRFAAVLGAARLAGGRRACLDFAHPRKPPPPPDTTKRMRLAGIGVAGVAALGALLYMRQLQSLDSQISSLQGEISSVKEEIAEYDKATRRLQLIEQWTSTDVNVLDELALVSKRAPGADQVIFSDFDFSTLSAVRGGGAQLTLPAKAKGEEVRMETEMRLWPDQASDHLPTAGASSQGEDGDYPLQFSESIRLNKVGPEQYLQWMEAPTTVGGPDAGPDGAEASSQDDAAAGDATDEDAAVAPGESTEPSPAAADDETATATSPSEEQPS